MALPKRWSNLRWKIRDGGIATFTATFIGTLFERRPPPEIIAIPPKLPRHQPAVHRLRYGDTLGSGGAKEVRLDPADRRIAPARRFSAVGGRLGFGGIVAGVVASLLLVAARQAPEPTARAAVREDNEGQPHQTPQASPPRVSAKPVVDLTRSLPVGQREWVDTTIALGRSHVTGCGSLRVSPIETAVTLARCEDIDGVVAYYIAFTASRGVDGPYMSKDTLMYALHRKWGGYQFMAPVDWSGNLHRNGH